MPTPPHGTRPPLAQSRGHPWVHGVSGPPRSPCSHCCPWGPRKFPATTAPPWVPSIPMSPQPRARLKGHRWQPCTQARVPKQAWRHWARAVGTRWGRGGPAVAGAAACTQTKGSPCPAAGSVPAAASPTAPVQVTGLARDRGTSTGSGGGWWGGTARTLSLTAAAKQMAPGLAPACGEAGPSRAGAGAGATSSCGAQQGREPRWDEGSRRIAAGLQLPHSPPPPFFRRRWVGSAVAQGMRRAPGLPEAEGTPGGQRAQPPRPVRGWGRGRRSRRGPAGRIL